MGNLRIREAMRGFTLIELAIVVAVIAALMTMGLGLLNAQLTSSAQSVAKKRQEIVKEALVAFLGLHKRLPCPDVPNNTVGLADSSGVNGEEDKIGGDVTADCASPFGIVPYVALGLSREAAIDGWANFFSYRVFQHTKAPNLPTACGTVADWTQTRCFGTGKTGGIRVDDSAIPGNPTLTTNAIAVLISHGPNGLAAWAGATPNASPPVGANTCEERRNAGVDTSDCTTLPPDPTYFRGERGNLDDVVSWIDAAEAINSLSRQGAAKIAVAQLNQDLHELEDLTLGYKVQRSVASSDCNVSVSDAPNFFKDSFGNSRLDPWGNPFLVVEGTGTFPICICSGGSVPISSPPLTCPVSSPPTPATIICRRIDQVQFNPYVAKFGVSCPSPSP